MKISHEVPSFLLEESFKFNDFDYLLPLFWKYPEYQEHFKTAREQGRFIILDNGLFEGHAEDMVTLMNIADAVNPDVIISQDVWNNDDVTWSNWIKWREIFNPEKLMVVIQAENNINATELYYALVADGIKYIGFNHSGKFYDDYAMHSNPVLRKTIGRINFIHSLELDKDVHHHLLGTNLAEEFKYYHDLPQIKSGDTSNPVMLAFEGKEYDGSITYKPMTKMEDVFDRKLDSWELELVSARILRNINYFRKNYIL